jgi:hypothetical protein
VENNINEHGVVKLSVDYKNMKKGTTGTIIHKYNEDNFEVEFLVDGKPVVETVEREVITKK